MPSSFHNFLNQPYPYYYRGRSLLVFVLVIFVAGTSFNYFFEPFGVNPAEQRMSYFWICAVHSLNAVMAIMLVAALAHPFIEEDKWTVGREVLFLIIALLVIGIAQFLLRDLIYDNPNNWSMGYFLEEIRNTYLIGGLIILMMVSLNFNRLYFQNRIEAQSIIIQASEETNQRPLMVIETDVQQDNFNLQPNSLIYAHSEKNYLNLYMDVEGKLEHKLIRLTMKRFEDQLQAIPDLMRVHRSYLINLRRINAIEGNASGYQLLLDGIELEIPVSRSFIPRFQKQMQAMA